MANILIHGDSHSSEYKIWASIKQRCYNKNSPSYCRYGGRGIDMSDKWKSDYRNFLKDMGRKPNKNFSIERVNNNKGYSKQNCMWVDIATQNRNRRSTVFFKGENMKEAAKRLGLSKQAITKRILLGWSKRKAFTTPRVEKYKNYISKQVKLT